MELPAVGNCEEKVMHRWGWGYMRPCARHATSVGADGKKRCTFHARRVEQKRKKDGSKR